jgi:starch-binding outer membrane protein, SusD/RagB family
MKKITILMLTLVFIQSCQTDLDAVKPEDLTTRDLAIKTKIGVNSFVTGLYGLSQQEGALNGVAQLLGEYQSDNSVFRGSFPTLTDIRDYTTISDNGNVLSVWQDHYEVIAQANYIIANVDKCTDLFFTIADKNQAIGEAKFMRALMYLELANLFSQPIQTAGANTPAVPLVLTVNPDDLAGTINTPRATLGAVYAQIENDLLDASVKITSMSRSRANSGACLALLSRVYLYQDKFVPATNAANSVIGMSDFVFATDYTFYDSPDNKEHVFTLVNNPNDGQSNSTPNGTSAVAFSNETNSVANNGRGDVPFSADLNAVFNATPGDIRNSIALKVADARLATRFFTTKYKDAQNLGSDANVIRISEIYLNRAEANFRASTAVGDTPLNDVNKIRKRAGIPLLTTITLNDILLERRKEFCFEGFRRMDLLRNGLKLRNATLPKTEFSSPGMDRVIMPIPQREIDLSRGVLAQNKGY